ncbi:hypothetical protein HOR19_gp12 [Phage MedPE-SWcel-C56]|uniref:Uncharacterized protein n=1 Tax=Phage MedPE-SWcel-C56 TaxID=1871314 RepID=A0A1B1IY10_9CAUD|nr:hypothetical protein HOR19_gp12 [Phage MedPE-SWcel-C56]ANS06205.1 hypothetical protein [Phage MedPE-SWcel-C56]
MGIKALLKSNFLQRTLDAMFAVGKRATQDEGVVRLDYKAPHAMRGTPERRPRRSSSVLAPRLFKGHRP